MLLKREKYSLAGCVFGMLVLSACGSADLQEEQKKIDIEEQTQTIFQEETEPKSQEKMPEHFFRCGEIVTWSDYYGQEVEYLLKDVSIADNINEFGIDTEKITSLGLDRILESGEIVNNSDQNYVFVKADVKIKNKTFKNYSNGKTLENMYSYYVDTLLTTETELQDDEGIRHIGQAIYFSLCAEDEKDYFKFNIEQGEEVQAVLIWIVPEKDLEEPLYYLIGETTGKNSYQYILMNEEMLK